MEPKSLMIGYSNVELAGVKFPMHGPLTVVIPLGPTAQEAPRRTLKPEIEAFIATTPRRAHISVPDEHGRARRERFAFACAAMKAALDEPGGLRFRHVESAILHSEVDTFLARLWLAEAVSVLSGELSEPEKCDRYWRDRSSERSSAMTPAQWAAFDRAMGHLWERMLDFSSKAWCSSGRAGQAADICCTLVRIGARAWLLAPKGGPA